MPLDVPEMAIDDRSRLSSKAPRPKIFGFVAMGEGEQIMGQKRV